MLIHFLQRENGDAIVGAAVVRAERASIAWRYLFTIVHPGPLCAMLNVFSVLHLPLAISASDGACRALTWMRVHILRLHCLLTRVAFHLSMLAYKQVLRQVSMFRTHLSLPWTSVSCIQALHTQLINLMLHESIGLELLRMEWNTTLRASGRTCQLQA